jgi:hypothetical protein
MLDQFPPITAPHYGDQAKYMTDATGNVIGFLKPQTRDQRAPVPMFSTDPVTGKVSLEAEPNGTRYAALPLDADGNAIANIVPRTNTLAALLAISGSLGEVMTPTDAKGVVVQNAASVGGTQRLKPLEVKHRGWIVPVLTTAEVIYTADVGFKPKLLYVLAGAGGAGTGYSAGFFVQSEDREVAAAGVGGLITTIIPGAPYYGPTSYLLIQQPATPSGTATINVAPTLTETGFTLSVLSDTAVAAGGEFEIMTICLG